MSRLIILFCTLMMVHLHAGNEHEIWCSVEKAVCENAVNTNAEVKRIYFESRTKFKIKNPSGLLKHVDDLATASLFFNSFAESKGNKVPLCKELKREYPIVGSPEEYWQKAEEAGRWASTHVPTEPDYREPDFGYYYLASELSKTTETKYLVVLVQNVFYLERDEQKILQGYSQYGQGMTTYLVFEITLVDAIPTVTLLNTIEMQGY